MKFRMISKTGMAMLTLFFGLTSSAHACRTLTLLTEVKKSKADVVFVGAPIAYYSKEIMLNKRPWRTVDISIRVDKVLEGALSDAEIRVRYPTAYSVPLNGLNDFIQLYGDKTKVGLIMPDTFKQWCTEDKNSKSGVSCNGEFVVETYFEAALETPRILGVPCGNLYLETYKEP